MSGTTVDRSNSSRGISMDTRVSMRSDSSMRSSSRSAESDGDEEESFPKVAKQRVRFGEEENKAVNLVRRFLYVLFFAVAGGVSYLVYYLTDKAETDNFESQFREDTSRILQSFAMSMDLTFGAMDSLALEIASHARSTQQEWPFVTIPDFAVRAEKTRALTNAVYIAMYNNVPEGQRYQWENYTAIYGPQWVKESMELQEREGIFQDALRDIDIEGFEDVLLWNVLYDYDEWEKPEEEWGTVGRSPNETGPFLPMWQTSPLIPVDPPYNWDLMSWTFLDDIVQVFDSHKVEITETYLIAEEGDIETIEENEAEAEWISAYITTGEDPHEPIADISYPIIADSPDWVKVPFASGDYNPEEHWVGALLSASIYWRDWIKGILSEGHDGIHVVWTSSCAPPFTYEIHGPLVEFLGAGDRHESEFDDLRISASVYELNQYTFRNQYYTGIPLNENLVCDFSLHMYPSTTMEEDFRTNKPALYCGLTAGLFVLAAIGFVFYDYMVEKRKQKLVDTANKTDAIVSNMLPAEIRDRLYTTTTMGLDENDSSDLGENGRIAELYPSATIISIDIAGFTAWASTREPGQVFELLETIYGRWDKIASHHGVLKIESVGDQYMACCGLPTPRENHVVAIARFAQDVLHEWPSMTRKLEVALGPDTTDLKVRIGIHSGQVTAGIMRGSMSRYQLFGQSVYTAANLQATSQQGKAQISQSSAQLLESFGKGKWIQPCKCPGNNESSTYWLLPKGKQRNKSASNSMSPEMAIISEDADEHTENGEEDYSESSNFDILDGLQDDLSKTGRLVEWNTQVLSDLLQSILVARNNDAADPWSVIHETENDIVSKGTTVLEEFEEIIMLPQFTKNVVQHGQSMNSIELSATIRGQLRGYLTVVAGLYQPNPFHNFEHASHVTASVRKLLSRIVQVDQTNPGGSPTTLQDLEGHSYGITSDPLTQFAVVFSAVIHDCQHPGVSNARLVEEKHPHAIAYKGKSIAEQNSVDLCWNLLMQPEYSELRKCIYQNQDELLRFRQLVVNIVMATDICDRELGALRKARWAVAFSEDPIDSSPELDMNRKATIVLEHLIQASDVCHTMQHWDVYKDWNEKFFFELYSNYRKGRASEDPSANWYQGEIGFFDFYVIPLAKKLDKCGVFGVSSHEYENYAKFNRDEWARCGEACVAEYLSKYELVCQQEATPSKSVV